MTVSATRPFTSYSKVQRLIGTVIRNRRVFVPRAVIARKSLLNVGCGPNCFSEFINLDYDWRPGIDVCWDIRERLPFVEDSLEGVFTEHCLEHVSYWDCVSALKEFCRVLSPGGVVRVIVPDGGLYLELYQRATDGEAVEFPYVDKVGLADREEDGKVRFTPMMAVNRIFRGYGHLFAYDFETMSSLLEFAGFEDVRKTAYRSGRCQALLIDSALRAPQSLCIEAMKPRLT